MCIFCVGDDTPFYLRKSTAFPGKMRAEAVGGDTVPCEKAKAATGAVDRQETKAESGCSPNDLLPRSGEAAD